MSTSIYKVDYVCDCGIDYGDCGAKCSLILKSQNSVDIYTLYRTDSHSYKGNREPRTSVEVPYCFGDSYLHALKQLLTFEDGLDETNKLTEEQEKIMFK